jgi:toxin ParE1/3/4
MSHRVVFRTIAEEAPFTLYRYIADRSGAVRAGDFIARIEQACLALSNLPERGTRRDDILPGLQVLSAA